MAVHQLVVAQFGGEEEPQRTAAARVFPGGWTVFQSVLAGGYWSVHGQSADVAARLADARQFVVGDQVRLKPCRRVERAVGGGATQQAAVNAAVLEDMRRNVDAHLAFTGERLLTFDALERLGRRRNVELCETVTALAGQTDVVDGAAGRTDRS